MAGIYDSGKIGVTDGSSAPAGQIGEYLLNNSFDWSTNPTNGSWVAVPGATLTLTAGDWDLAANGMVVPIGGNSGLSRFLTGLSTTAAVSPTVQEAITRYDAPVASQLPIISWALPRWRVNVTTSTTIYLNYFVVWTGGTNSPEIFGAMSARRFR